MMSPKTDRETTAGAAGLRMARFFLQLSLVPGQCHRLGDLTAEYGVSRATMLLTYSALKKLGDKTIETFTSGNNRYFVVYEVPGEDELTRLRRAVAFLQRPDSRLSE
jgi:hypothetical protein